MATTGRILGALALFITALGAVAESPVCQIWVRYPDLCAPGGSLDYRATSDEWCQAACNNYGGRCKGYMWNTNVPPDNACHLFFDQIDIINSRRCPGVRTNVNNCLTTYPFPTTTASTKYPPFGSDYPPYGSTNPPCPPVEGLGEGLVVLVGVFSAVGGAILGMLLAYLLCPRKAAFGNGSKKPSCDCPKKEMPSHAVMPSAEPGKVYSVPKTSLNGEPYTVNINLR